MSNLYQLYAFITVKYWELHLKDRWPDAPLHNGYRVLVFTNLDLAEIKSQFKFKELSANETISAIIAGDESLLICDHSKLMQIINHFSPPEQV